MRRKVNEEMPYISKSQYKATLSRMRDKLYEIDLDYSKCKFVTLETADEIEWDDLQYGLKKYIKAMKYHYEFSYINAIECYEKGFNRYHVHIIFIFDNIKPTNKEIKNMNLWKYGYVDCRDLIEDKEKGLIEYITKFKTNNINPINPEYTKFPQFSKFINYSRNLPLNQIWSFDADNESIKSILEYANQINAHITERSHIYNDINYKDFTYIHNAKELIEKI